MTPIRPSLPQPNPPASSRPALNDARAAFFQAVLAKTAEVPAAKPAAPAQAPVQARPAEPAADAYRRPGSFLDIKV